MLQVHKLEKLERERLVPVKEGLNYGTWLAGQTRGAHCVMVIGDHECMPWFGTDNVAQIKVFKETEFLEGWQKNGPLEGNYWISSAVDRAKLPPLDSFPVVFEIDEQRKAIHSAINRAAMIVMVSGGSPSSRMQLSEALEKLCAIDPAAANEYAEIKAQAEKWEADRRARSTPPLEPSKD